MNVPDQHRSDHHRLLADPPTTRRVAVITLGEADVVTGWSPGARYLLGYLADQVVGVPVGRLIASDPGVLSSVTEEWDGDVTLRHASGRLLTVPVRACRLSDGGAGQRALLAVAPEDDAADGTAHGTAADTAAGPHHGTHHVTHDVTHDVAEVFALPDGPAMLDWLFSASPVPLTVYDTDLRCVWQNTAMSRMTGTSQCERRGTRPGDVLTSPDIARWEACMREAMRSGTDAAPCTMHARTRADPDHDRVLLATASPLRGSAGRILGVCATVHDVTEPHAYRERLALLNEAGARIGSTLDLSVTAQELADVLVPRLADFVSVDLLEPLLRGDEPGPVVTGVTLRRMAHQSVNEGAPEATAAPGAVDTYPPSSPPVRCLAEGRPLLLRCRDSRVSRWFADDPVRAERAEQYGFHSWLLVPIRARGVTLGLTVFCRSWPNQPFEHDDLLLAEEVVTRAAISLDNARSYTREHTAALALQRSLLPRELPRRPALEATFRYLPASSQFGVGGDWVDVIPLSGGRVALVIGDVVGHGIHAAATMGRLRTAVRTLADVDLAPDELLTRLDDQVTHLDAGEAGAPEGSDTSEATASCLYAVYDPVTRNCSVASAGQPPPALLTPDGDVTFPAVECGPPLGGCGLPYVTSELRLRDGSELVLYTDGLISTRAGEIDENLERLRRALARPASSVDARCDAVVRALLPEHPEDDVAVLIARTHALDEDRVATWDVPADPAVVADARSWATRRMAGWGLEDMACVTELVVSELVTNAIRYGTPPIQLRLIKDNALICEVSDTSSTAPHLRRTPVFDEGGRGLLLVAQLTQRWGSRHSRDGKTIWCEQPVPPEARDA
ncbi:SpoIIE family protein phosphatase [Streptomyces sp. DSM 42041]|uniref:SpoIIE family protein phosphatase n=1 Tax=Streptomyces hazeniae TaxID=3075538 RepID=A0ABU2NT93_9ACTN|nr:SpoIIE family protein phosphatase [Streptomyces sp. DSM 42041]MDT0380206.1 SpoIIE family protein phosphatase [Streptomyces sp. DSM 42041]